MIEVTIEVPGSKTVSWLSGDFTCPKCGEVHRTRNCNDENCSLKKQRVVHGHCIMCDEETPIKL